jgi:ferredoxin
VRVHVIQEKCQGHNRCYALAPDLFEVDDFGTAREVGDGTVPPGMEDLARLAAANCPEYAIEVLEDDGTPIPL